MKMLFAILFAGCAALAGYTSAQPGIGPVCTGRFPNLITDICYDCMFPVSLAGNLINIGVSGDDYDSGAGGAPVCLCAASLTVGTPMSFWEPTYMVDVTNKPGCMPLLGGIDISPPFNSLEYGAEQRSAAPSGSLKKSAFMHVNEYINPVMTALGVISDSPCLDQRGFDVPFISWADPTWNDDALAMVLTPYGYAFGGIPSIAAEAPDAIAASTGFPTASLFWVAGAWGPMYPVTGNVASANSPEQVAHLLTARLFAKLHAAGVQQSTAGLAALRSCGAMGIPEFLMDKRQYKTNRVFPFPDNTCTPFGRPLLLQEKGAARPQDKDYGYFIFRKKDCCAPVYSPL
ncbi:TraU family protein [Massilia jejuensis]|uniref:TraU family protein n=1 Tax=Massilia jejuensis TaxID=648894 RepID=A0ABW0PD83_9BURK